MWMYVYIAGMTSMIGTPTLNVGEGTANSTAAMNGINASIVHAMQKEIDVLKSTIKTHEDMLEKEKAEKESMRLELEKSKAAHDREIQDLRIKLAEEATEEVCHCDPMGN